jgi:hypothetical protein
MEMEDIIDFKVYIPRLQAWFWKQMADLYASPSAPEPLNPQRVLMGLPLWGDDFIDRFCFFCLPSLRSKKNWEALAGRSRLVLFTDGPGFLRLFQVAADLERQGMKVDVHVIPPEVMEFVDGTAKAKAQADLDVMKGRGNATTAELRQAETEVKKAGSPLNRYWLLGTCQNFSLQICRRDRWGYHALHPDHIHSEAYFANMFRLAESHDGIASTTISAEITGVLDELEAYRQSDGSLVIPDLELGDMGWRHVHKQTLNNVMNGRDLNKELPDSHMLIWKGKDKIHLFCCHLNAVWIAPHVCARAPIRLYNAIDTEIPNFMDGLIAIPEAHDGMTMLELSDDNKKFNTHRVNFTDFAVRCWTTVHWRDNYTPFFKMVNEVPIKEREGEEFASVELIKAQHAAICEGLQKIKEPLKAEWDKKKAEREAEVGVSATNAEINFPDPVQAQKQTLAQPKSGRALRRQQAALARQNGAAHAHA